MLPSGYGGIFTMSRVGHRAGSIVSILDLFLFDSCLQISEWECVKHSLSLYLMSTFIWEANWSYVLKLRHRFLICINAYPSSSVRIFSFCILNHTSWILTQSSQDMSLFFNYVFRCLLFQMFYLFFYYLLQWEKNALNRLNENIILLEINCLINYVITNYFVIST